MLVFVFQLMIDNNSLDVKFTIAIIVRNINIVTLILSNTINRTEGDTNIVNYIIRKNAEGVKCKFIIMWNCMPE